MCRLRKKAELRIPWHYSIYFEAAYFVRAEPIGAVQD